MHDLIRSCIELANRIENAKLAERFAQWSDVWGDLNRLLSVQRLLAA
jgi:hypothetical protein